LAARVEIDRHDALGRGQLGELGSGGDLLADLRLRLADPRRARPEDDLAPGERAVVVESAGALEARRNAAGAPSSW
jgi:hypothetical protein